MIKHISTFLPLLGMLLHWAAEYFEKLLPEHLLKRQKEARVDPKIDGVTSVPYLNAETGEIVKNIDLPSAERVSRNKIRKLLTEGEDLDIEVQYLILIGTGIRLTSVCSSTGD